MEQDQRFRKKHRLLKQKDFDRVYFGKAYAADHTLVINGCENGLNCSRLGLSVSRKVGNAVVRNRWKRLIRESFRISRTELPVGIDLVVRPRRGAVCEFKQISASLRKLARQLKNRIEKQQQKRERK